jgi:gliding motility-associated-like protein
MVKLKLKTVLTLVCFFLSMHVAFSQGKINVGARQCLGSISSMSYTAPSGLTVSSLSWAFGDGATSGSNSPIHTYGATGKYTITVQATFTNSTTATDSQELEVVGLPKAFMYFDRKSDTCFNHNNVCYIDTSKPAATGQKIVSRLIVWGDGGVDQSFTPAYGDTICHTYTVNDKYNLKIEVTDLYGCKSSAPATISVVENIDANFSFTNYFLDCKTANICVKNFSTGGNPATAHYKWYVDTAKMDTMPYFVNFKCVPFTRTKNLTLMLIAHANNGCIDTMTKMVPLVIDSLPTVLELKDTSMCFYDNILDEATFKNTHYDRLYWYFDGGYDPFRTNQTVYFQTQQTPGLHEVKVEIMRGTCATTLKANYRVLGPMARIKVIDREQCFGSREVFFVENSLGSQRKNCVFQWTIRDSLGDNCTNDRIHDVNKYKNCNYSVDWFTKHRFSSQLRKTYYVTLWVKDTVIGCQDTVMTYVDNNYCSKLLDFDSVDVCKGNIFLENITPPYPVEFTLDSAKQIWKKFGTVLDPSLSGSYDVGMRFESKVSPWAETIGDDSIREHTDTAIYYDTVYRKNYLYIREPIKDSVYIKVYGNCQPFRVSMFFKDGTFTKDESLYVVWGGGDSVNYERTFTGPTKVDSIFQTFSKSTGIQAEMRIEMKTRFGCVSRYQISLTKGKAISKNHSRFQCLNNETCFTPYVYELKDYVFWTTNTPYRDVSWWFDDTGRVNAFNPCYKFKSGGPHLMSMIVRDSLNCLDTLKDTVFVQDLRANIKHTSRFLYCSELKQFFDSSSYIVMRGDSIKKHLWQFGDGVFSSVKKNPVQSITTSLAKIQAAHAIESVHGCTDTFRFEIEVIGPKPYFSIRDTIGCGSLNAVFDNLSKNCRQYIWQFGDSLKTTYQTFDQLPANFLYKKPGRYFISLVGIDTVYNPFTNSRQPCISTFPDKVFQKDTNRSVLVLPYFTTGIESKDTICLGTSLLLTSKSDTAYDYDLWQMGDGESLKLPEAGSTSYQYKKTGLFRLKLSPGFQSATSNLCRDSAQKDILVMGADADFDIDPSSVPPVFLFHDKSIPLGMRLSWDFDHPNSGSLNTSEETDPNHDYKMDTGTYKVCLIARIPFGCADTVCKTLVNDHQEDFGIFNVFTPGNADGKNDQYDIRIENEDLYELSIYDRWGKLVYESHEDADNSQNLNWNGKIRNQGAECPSGTYYYIFRYSLKQAPGKITTLNGNITLIR